jgi:hypothetical protein
MRPCGPPPLIGGRTPRQTYFRSPLMTLGRIAVKVSPYCLGVMMFGAIRNPNQQGNSWR